VASRRRCASSPSGAVWPLVVVKWDRTQRSGAYAFSWIGTPINPRSPVLRYRPHRGLGRGVPSLPIGSIRSQVSPTGTGGTPRHLLTCLTCCEVARCPLRSGLSADDLSDGSSRLTPFEFELAIAPCREYYVITEDSFHSNPHQTHNERVGRQ
jgi:hypothetical protein